MNHIEQIAGEPTFRIRFVRVEIYRNADSREEFHLYPPPSGQSHNLSYLDSGSKVFRLT